MRWSIAVMLCLLLMPLPTSAEEVQTPLIDDDSGDVALASADGEVTQAEPTGQFQDVDLTAVGLWAEDAGSITFFLEVADLTESSQRPTPFGDPDYELHFAFGQQDYRVRVITVLDNPANSAFGREAGAFAWLERQVDADQYRRIADADAELDFSGDMVRVTIPRTAVVDENQAPLSVNRTLTDFYAVAESMGWFQFPVGGFQGDPIATVGIPKAFDMAPDGGPDATLPSYQMTTGDLKQRGQLVATSQDPVRWTNGEASTLTFVAQVTNTGPDDIPVGVQVRDARPEWTVAYSDRLTVPARTTANATVLVTIPFTHSHGNLHMFEVAFSGVDTTDYAATDLGVYWPEVPQPAGHHNRLWFHSAVPQDEDSFLLFDQFDDGIAAWMSASEDEESDEGLPIPSQFSIPPTPFTDTQAVAFWQIPLQPELRMGLDFRPEEMGVAEISVDFPVTVVDPVLEFALSHRTQGDQGRPGQGQAGRDTALVTARSDPITGTVSGAQTFTLDLDVLDAADDVPYDPQANLVATVVVRATFMAGGGFFNPEEVAPALLPDGSMLELPLNEYEDPIDLGFQTDGTLKITAGPEGQQRLVNAGRTAVYTFDLRYDGTQAATFDATVTGQNAAWAEIVGDASFPMEPGTTRTLGLAITAPRDASDGERADVTLTVVDATNAAVQAGINTVTIVDSSEDIPDEGERKDDLHGELSRTKEAPGLPVFLVLVVLAAALRRR